MSSTRDAGAFTREVARAARAPNEQNPRHESDEGYQERIMSEAAA